MAYQMLSELLSELLSEMPSPYPGLNSGFVLNTLQHQQHRVGGAGGRVLLLLHFEFKSDESGQLDPRAFR